MSTATLKKIALICMIIDHIGHFIPGMPIQMRWIGRISMPIFLYCFVNGIDETNNKEAYIKRLYGFNILTAVIIFGFNLMPEHRGFINVLSYNILGTFVAIFFLIEVMEFVRERRKGWIKIVCGYTLWQILSTALAMYVDFNMPICNTAFTLLISQISGNIFSNEGRFFVVLLGVGLFYAKKSKVKTAITYSLLILGHAALLLLEIPQRVFMRVSYMGNDFWEWIYARIMGIIGYDIISFTSVDPWNTRFEWMMIFALPFMLMYNGEKGKYHKYFYYVFYPAHLTVLIVIQLLIQ